MNIHTIFRCGYANGLRVWSTSHGEGTNDTLVSVVGVESSSIKGCGGGCEIEHYSRWNFGEDDVVHTDDSIDVVRGWG